MPDWAIVLAAAFGGGLAGAVLQPVVSYGMERLRRGEEIRKSRERSLRRMINHAIAEGRECAMLSFLIEEGLKHCAPLTPEQIGAKLNEAEGRLTWKDMPWQPDRIKDPALRQLALE